MARLVLNHLSESAYRQLSVAAAKRSVNVSELAVILLEIAVAELAADEAQRQSASPPSRGSPPTSPKV